MVLLTKHDVMTKIQTFSHRGQPANMQLQHKIVSKTKMFENTSHQKKILPQV